ncbi:unnamed protein product [Arctogadus glacialis]
MILLTIRTRLAPRGLLLLLRRQLLACSRGEGSIRDGWRSGAPPCFQDAGSVVQFELPQPGGAPQRTTVFGDCGNQTVLNQPPRPTDHVTCDEHSETSMPSRRTTPSGKHISCTRSPLPTRGSPDQYFSEPLSCAAFTSDHKSTEGNALRWFSPSSQLEERHPLRGPRPSEQRHMGDIMAINQRS